MRPIVYNMSEGARQIRYNAITPCFVKTRNFTPVDDNGERFWRRDFRVNFRRTERSRSRATSSDGIRKVAEKVAEKTFRRCRKQEESQWHHT